MDKELRKFGFSFGLALNILGCLMFYRHKGHFIWFTLTGSVVFISALISPKILGPLKRLLDRLIFFIGWLVSAISLLMVFYLIFTPTAILMKIFSRDLLNQRIDKKASTYWIERKQRPFSRESYERMG